MMTTNESLEKFKEKIDDLVNAKHLFAERKITEVLKVIAESRMLYELFEYVTRDFDYKTFKSVCFVAGGGVTLPKKDEDLLALCFLLLVEIDGGSESLDDICNECFPSGGSAQGKFSEFVVSVVIPFALTTEKVAYKLINAQNNPQSDSDVGAENTEIDKESDRVSARKVEASEKDEKPRRREKKLKYEFISEALDGALKRANKKKPEIIEQAVYIFGALDKALSKRDFEAVTLAFTALRYFAIVEKKLKIDPDKISDGIAAVM